MGYLSNEPGNPNSLTEVSHDSTLNGDGTISDPLSVNIDLTDYAKLAISTTQDNLYTNLIANSLLIPNQWYLVTDFLNEDVIAGTTILRGGLVDTYYNQDGNTSQLFYDDGVTPIVDGDTEEIYVRASSANTLYPIGYSKTFSKEQITFQQDVPNTTSNTNGYGYGEEDSYTYLDAYVDGDGIINNNYTELTLDSIQDEFTAIFSGTNLERFKNVFLGQGNTSFYFYNATSGLDFSCDEDNYGSDWTLDWETGEFNFPNEGFSFTDFEVEGSTVNGQFSSPRFIPFTGNTSGSPLYQESTTIYIDEIISDSQIKLAGSDLDKLLNRIPETFNFEVINDNIGSYIYFDDTNENIDWSFNYETGIFTDLTGNANFTDLIYQNCYYGFYFSFVVKIYQGRIIQRYRPLNSLTVGVDYRSKLNRRYKVLCNTWSAGTSTAGNVVRNNGFIWLCIETTTSTPNTDNRYWQKIIPDQYLMTNDVIYIYNYSISPNTSDFIDTPVFSTQSFLGYNKNIVCNNTINSKSNSPFDIVLYSDILSSYTNINIRSIKSTIYGQVQNSNIYSNICIFGDIYNTNILDGANTIIAYSSNSIIDYIGNTHCLSLTNLVAKFITYSIYKTTTECLIFKSAYILNKNTSSNNIFFNINSSVFTLACDKNIIKELYSSVFNSSLINNTIGLIRSTIYNGSVAGSTIPFVENSEFNSWSNVVVLRQVTSCNCIASWSDSTIGGSSGGINIPLTMASCKIDLLSNISGVGTVSLNSVNSTGIFGLVLSNTNTTLSISNVSGSKLISSLFYGRNNISTVILNGLITGAVFGSPAKTISSVSAGLINCTGHGLIANQTIVFYSTGTFPSGISSGTVYYVCASGLTANSFKISNSFDDNDIQSPSGTWTGTLTTLNSQSIESCVFGNISSGTFNGTRTIRSVFPSDFSGGNFKCFNDQLNYGLGSNQNVYDVRNLNTLFNKVGFGTTTPTSSFAHVGSEATNVTYLVTTTTLDDTMRNAICTGTFTVNLPNVSTCNGRLYTIKNIGTGVITVTPYSTNLIDGSSTKVLNPKQSVTIFNDSSAWAIIDDKIFHTLPTGNTGLGTITPNAKLDILGTARFGDSTNNYTAFEADGTMVMNGTATVYDDIQFNISSGKVSASNAPAWATWNGLSEYSFAVDDFIDLGAQEFKHDWKEGSAVELHVHWSTGTGNYVNGDKVKWQLEYTWTNMATSQPFTVFPAPTAVSAEQAFTTTVSPYSHVYTSVVSFTPTGGKIGAQLKVRLKRIAKSAGGTDPATNPFALQVGMHYEIDTIGSRTTSSK